MRCKAMLEKVASDNKKIARRVLGERAWEVGVIFFKTSVTLPPAIHLRCRV